MYRSIIEYCQLLQGENICIKVDVAEEVVVKAEGGR